MKKILCGVIPVLVLLFCSSLVHSQDTIRSGIKENARKHFAEKDYVQALPLYRELLNYYPREPEYQYCVGACLINLNGDVEEAINLLRPAAVTEYNPMAWFYLGRAYHLYYSFEDAIKAYSRFTLNGKPADVKSLDVERLIEMCRNGIEFTRTGRPVVVQNVKTIHIDQLPVAAEINGSGKLIRKPAEFCSKTDIRNNYRPWMYLPAYTEINEYVYCSGYESGKKGGKQIFRIRNINHTTWGIPEPLNGTINTKYDEEFPYFDIKTSTLYFSSKGHSSMGGYDIFKSVYDWNTKSWSAPQNLGFPINSPGDDFVYITDELNHSASFVSTRKSMPNQAELYRIRLEQDTTGIRFFTVDEIRKASELNVEEKAVLPVSVEIPQVKNIPSVNTDTLFYTPVKAEYNKVLSDALMLQVKADSLSRIVRDMRIMARESPDDSNKKQLISDMLRSDKEAKMLQREADEKFAEARKLRPSGNENSADSTINESTQVNNISVYQYVPGTTKAVALNEPTLKEPVIKENTPSNTESQQPKVQNKDVFSFLEKSPYNESNPIPRGMENTPGLIYRIQLGAFSKPKPNDAFGGINPVFFEQAQGTSVLKYYAGLFFSLNSVTKALETIRSNGFPDAFIVAFLDGKMITTEKAREIEFAGYQL